MSESLFPHSYAAVAAELRRRVRGSSGPTLQLLTGPRQVGKTTLLLELASEWGKQAIYAAADGPEAVLPGWWENLWRRAEGLAARKAALLLLDEVQYLGDWARMLKSRLDDARRRKVRLRVVASGSSALALGRGSRETMAGRFERLRLLHWPAGALAARFGIDGAEAARVFVERGCYPGAVPLLADTARWRVYLRESIIEPAIGRDLLAVQPVRKPALLRQVFAVAAGHPAEIVSVQKIAGQLSGEGALETISHYLHLLEEAALVAGLPKHSEREIRRRASPPKLIVLNNAILAALADQPPSPSANPSLWGRWVENACAALAWNSGQAVRYWREEPLEVDLVTEGSWGCWAIEVKTGPYSVRDLSGASEFCRRYPRFTPLLLCGREMEGPARAAGMAAQTWEDFLLRGPAP